MQTRRDQVQAQSYVWSRVVTALVVADADAAENPHRRTVVGTVSGLLVAALVVAGFAVLGFLRPGGARTWQAPGVLVVEKETGSRYVYVERRLRPVLNYASARLLSTRAPKVVTVSRRSLGAVPHGQPVGIVGAPDALPAPGRVAAQAWTVCAPSAPDQAGRTATATTLTITGAAARHDRPLTSEQAILVEAGGRTYLVWRGYRFRLTVEWLARVLGGEDSGAPVEETWLETVPAGPDLAPPEVPGRGAAGAPVDGRETRIGQLFVSRTAAGEERAYVLQRDGLSALSPLAYAVLVADPATARLYDGPVRPTGMSLGALAQLPASERRTLPQGIPDQLPRIVAAPPPGTAWCARQTMADGRVEITADLPASGAVTDGLALTRTSRTAAAITVAPGQGGLVVSGRFDQALGSRRYLVTDAGVKYPVTDADSAARLGYPASDARPASPRLLDLLPSGPALGTAAVRG